MLRPHMTKYLTTVELQKESMKFSAGHTTIFSATEREPLHGHLYQVALAITTWVDQTQGMTIDYRYYKQLIHKLCRDLNQTFLMPQFSPYLEYSEDELYYYFRFNHKNIPFLKEDVKILPLTNITVEELSRWFVEQLIQDTTILTQHQIEMIVIKVFSGPGQSANYTWKKQ